MTRAAEPEPATGLSGTVDLGTQAFAETTDLGPLPPPPSSIWEAALQLARRGAKAATFCPVADPGDGPQDLTAETCSLLRSRLRACTVILLFGSTVFLFRNFLLNPPAFLLLSHVAVVAVLLAALGVLSSAWPLSNTYLRVIEMFIFGAPLFEFAMSHLFIMSAAVTDGALAFRAASITPDRATLLALARSSAEVAAIVKSLVIFGLVMMVVYGLLVPARTRRVATFIGLLMVVLGGAQETALWFARDSIDFLRHVASFEMVSSNLLVAIIGAVLALSGSRLINSLRIEAFEARRMGQYTIGRKLGGGGMGEVFLAEHRLLKRPCAIKLIRPDRAGDPLALRRFEREVRSTARLTHWNTVEVYDYGRTDDGTFYYVMEYLRGLSLDDLVDRYGPLPPGRVVYLIRQACDALAEAHAAGLVHRDLKPGNLFAAARGGLTDVTKVLDFGLVKPIGISRGGHLAELTEQGKITGSPQFMAPEQAAGSALVDHRCDLHALGACAYFLLTGEAPFRGGSVLQVLASVSRDVPVPPSLLRNGIDSDLERVILRCLAKQPADRPSSATELSTLLESCRCASGWSSSAAATWWSLHEPEAIRPVAIDLGASRE